MTHWPRCSLESLLQARTLSYGVVQPGKHEADGVPIVRVMDLVGGRIDSSRPLRVGREVDERHSRTRLQGGEVLLSVVGTVGRIAKVPALFQGWNVARAIAVLRPTSAIHGDWLYYALQTSDVQGQMRQRQTDTVQATLNLRDVAVLQVPRPSDMEMAAIVGVLSALDELIDHDRSLISTLREIRSALYTALRESPVEEVSFLDAITVDFGGAFKGAHFSAVGTGRPLVRIRDLKTQRPQVWTTEVLSGAPTVSAGDVLAGMDAEFRATVWVGTEALLNQRVCRFSSHLGSNAWVLEAVRQPLAYIEGHKTGTTVAHMNKRDLEEVKVVVPVDKHAFDTFCSGAQHLLDAEVALHAEVGQLVHVRDELLPLLMSGKLRVGEVAA